MFFRRVALKNDTLTGLMTESNHVLRSGECCTQPDELQQYCSRSHQDDPCLLLSDSLYELMWLTLKHNTLPTWSTSVRSLDLCLSFSSIVSIRDKNLNLLQMLIFIWWHCAYNVNQWDIDHSAAEMDMI